MTRIRRASTVSPEPGDRFCEGLGFVAGAAERSFLVSVPFDVEFSGGMVNVIPLTGGLQSIMAAGRGRDSTDRY